MFNRFACRLIIVLAVLGVLDAGYLTLHHADPRSIGCTITGGCGNVLTSRLAHIGPIPTAALGLLMYVTIIVLAHRAVRSPWANENTPDHFAILLALTASAGAAISWYLQYYAVVIVEAFCPYCFTSAILISVIAIFALANVVFAQREPEGEQRLVMGVLVGIGLLLAGQFYLQHSVPPENPPIPRIAANELAKIVMADTAWIKGRAGAPATLIEFADYQCPHCKDASSVADSLLKANPARFRLAFRNYPLPRHMFAKAAAAAAIAAGRQGKFWQMHDMLFNHQADMEVAGFSANTFDQFATDLGLDVARFKKDRSSDAVLSQVETDAKTADRLVITSTPTFFVVKKAGATRLGGLEELNSAIADRASPIWTK